MNKKYKLKKSAIIIICLITISLITLITFIFSLFKTKSYSLEYNLSDFAISENYDDSEKIYYYEITYQDITYNFIYPTKRLKSDKLITDINTIEKDGYVCLLIASEKIESKPVCSKEKELIDFYLTPKELQEEIPKYVEETKLVNTTYQNYSIYNQDNNIIIWSYKGFNYLKNDEIFFIKLFDKDIYDIPHATKINNFLVIPNYEQEYNFDELLLINLDNNDVTTWKLDYEISFDSYILGTNDKSIYLIDNKNKKEYELVPHKKKMRILATSKRQGIVFNNGVEEKIAMSKLTTNTYSFTYKNNYHYTLEDNTLYLSYINKNNKIKVSDQKVTRIISTEEDNIYYLVKDTIYKYNLKYGEIKLISYSEWEFNNQNLIFTN